MDIKAFKMDGLGNDFVIIDQRSKSIDLTKQQIIKICNRKYIGCDQLILIKKNSIKEISIESKGIEQKIQNIYKILWTVPLFGLIPLLKLKFLRTL